ncbi:MAG: hypothetical protein EOS78_04820 [Mesorhizobium sp.]|uniref:hypothetical protein n=1 Tax=unclassified Mesorhizobium TaxID=325217 RepID=UPI000F75CC88|nr:MULTISPECIES: hypothetical protein [unclassified Mesorhizobium]AZO56391.1 hypothetical protein EJ077_25545 [Mesorhizobium sp. M8A.F.Ca.ET.057.01.1.1]RWE42711.1 MAG: hypothetical protein EOS78_04820 [Mesorhizobium sp.]RWE48729.1 MAG: hypothetical protein EOS80_04255 [Mesorhizobium sp.]TJX75520.1 MAG: hypothetical protein E5W21_04585 [Mesorhizobium sp.]
MKAVLLAIPILAALAGCKESNTDPVKSKTDNSQPVDKNPQIDRNPTPQTSTGGDQQGTQPTQPAAPKP